MADQLHAKRLPSWVLVLLTGLYSGCAYTESSVSPPVEPPARFSFSGDMPMEETWWAAFQSEELTGLVEQALAGNLDLKVAWYRLAEARAIAQRESASLWPVVDLGTTAQWQRPERPEGDSLQLDLSAAYEVDMWGRVRASVEAGERLAEASAGDFQAAVLSVSAEVARAAFRVVTTRQQVVLLSSQVETNEKVLASLRNRFGMGQILRGDLIRQSQLLEATRNQLLEAESRLQVQKHQLSILLGEDPGEPLPALPATLPGLPPLPVTGMPGELMQRRPDVQAAYNRLRAADREMAVAVAERLPRLSFSGSVFTEETDSVKLFDEWIRRLAANLALPLIDGGRRRAEVDRTEAVKLQRLYAYGQVTLEAFAEVENALVQEAKQLDRVRSIGEQARLAEEAYQQLRRQYANGVSDYLDVLSTLTEEQRLRRELLSARLAVYEFRIALYRALAGGIPPADLPIEPKQ